MNMKSGKRTIKKLRRFTVKNRVVIWRMRLCVYGSAGVLSYMADYHYGLILPAVCVLIFLDSKRGF